MEEILKNALGEDEKILWLGRPAPEKLGQAPDVARQRRDWIICIVVALATCLTFPYMIRIGQGPLTMLVWFVIINVVPIIRAVRPAMDQRLLERKTAYAITDRQVIAVVKEEVQSLPLQGLEWVIDRREGTVGAIRFGAAIPVKRLDHRAAAVTGVKDDDGRRGMVFYRVDKVDEVAGFLPRKEKVDIG